MKTKVLFIQYFFALFLSHLLFARIFDFSLQGTRFSQSAVLSITEGLKLAWSLLRSRHGRSWELFSQKEAHLPTQIGLVSLAIWIVINTNLYFYLLSTTDISTILSVKTMAPLMIIFYLNAQERHFRSFAFVAVFLLSVGMLLTLVYFYSYILDLYIVRTSS